jgi:putative membrane protein
MKVITLNVVTAFVLFIVASACEPKKQADSAEVAKETNEAAIEDSDDEKDADFVVNTIAANYAEVKLAQLAQSRSNDGGIKDLAKMLENDHTKVIGELKSYASEKGIAVPVEETNDDKEEISKLAGISDGNEFDEKWCAELKNRHEKSINKFEKRLEKTDDMELKDWVAATLPALKTHLDMLKENEERLN